MVAHADEPHEDLADRQVLVVDDEPLIRALLAEELRNLGLRVIEASSADEAWSVWTSGLQVDLLFTDVHMPGRMDGSELAHRVRAERPDMPIIVMSGAAAPSSVPLAALFLRKPFDLLTSAKLAAKLIRGTDTDDDDQAADIDRRR